MYEPDKKILERYADILVNFAAGGGKGIKKGEVVYVSVQEYAKPLYVEILRAITKAGGHAISQYLPDNDRRFNITRDFYVNAQDHQIRFFASRYFRGLIDEIDHYIFITSDTDKEALKGIDPKKMMARSQALRPFREWRTEKESRGRFTWVIALYGTAALAREVGMTERAYWRQIIDARFLEERDPIAKWREIERQIAAFKDKLNGMRIERIHVEGPAADLWLTIGGNRLWEGGSGRNIPSFEIFTSPDWRGTEGRIRFNQPIYTHGQIIRGASLKFRKGTVVEAKAAKNEKLLKELIAAPNGNKVGEFSLTDRRFSRITKFMAETLYDENVGGPNGNTHVAVGDSFHDCYTGDPNRLKKADWKRLGFNSSAVHQDMISTEPRTVTAFLKGGKSKVIYRNGQFTL